MSHEEVAAKAVKGAWMLMESLNNGEIEAEQVVPLFQKLYAKCPDVATTFQNYVDNDKALQKNKSQNFGNKFLATLFEEAAEEDHDKSPTELIRRLFSAPHSPENNGESPNLS